MIAAGTTVYVVEEQGGTFAFAKSSDAVEFAKREIAGGSIDVTQFEYVTLIDHPDWDAVAEAAIGQGPSA